MLTKSLSHCECVCVCWSVANLPANTMLLQLLLLIDSFLFTRFGSFCLFYVFPQFYFTFRSVVTTL